MPGGPAVRRAMSPCDLTSAITLGLACPSRDDQLRHVLFLAADLRDEAAVAVRHEAVKDEREAIEPTISPRRMASWSRCRYSRSDLDRQFQRIGERHRLDIGGAAEAGGREIDRLLLARRGRRRS